MSQKTPKVGIALAAYQPNLTFFKIQLDSIQAQSFQSWICVVNFDSNIESIKLDEDFQKYFLDARFIWLENKTRLGHTLNFEKAVALCIERFPDIKYIGFSDQDDIWYPTKLEWLLKTLTDAPPLSGAHSNFDLLFTDDSRKPGFQFEGRQVEGIELFDLALRNVCTGASSLFDADLFRKYPKIHPSFKDHDQWYALLAFIEGRLIPIEQPLYAYRQHESNLIGAQKKSGLIFLRKKWDLNSFLTHCVNIDQTFRQHILALPIKENDKKLLLSHRKLLRSLVRTLFLGNLMVTRLCVARIFGIIFSARGESHRLKH